MGKNELKQCPFCGCEALCYETYSIPRIVLDGPCSYSIYCGDCGIDLIRESREEAIQAWNKRIPDASCEGEKEKSHDGPFYFGSGMKCKDCGNRMGIMDRKKDAPQSYVCSNCGRVDYI